MGSMVAIQIDEQTAATLKRQAKDAGLSVADYVRTLVPSTAAPTRLSGDEIEAAMIAHSTPGPSLPADFSRGDIYSDHD
jgi:hypothetical protein